MFGITCWSLTVSSAIDLPRLVVSVLTRDSSWRHSLCGRFDRLLASLHSGGHCPERMVFRLHHRHDCRGIRRAGLIRPLRVVLGPGAIPQRQASD